MNNEIKIVKCIDSLYPTVKLTIGKLYKVKESENDKFYRVIADDNNEEQLCYKYRFELVDINEIKELTLQDIFNEEEGIKYNRINGGSGIYTIQNETLIIGEHIKPVLNKRIMDSKFVKVKVERLVSFSDVINSDYKCKVKHYRVEGLIQEESSYTWLEEYQDLKDIMLALSEEFNTIALKEIINKGQWYLEN